MRFVAAELAAHRAPANVMRWVATQDAQTAMSKAGRNDPCPCGSGKKFQALLRRLRMTASSVYF